MPTREDGRNTVFPFLIYADVVSLCLKKPLEKRSGATSLSMSQKIRKPFLFNQKNHFLLIGKSTGDANFPVLQHVVIGEALRA